ncbi:MAG: phosphoribosylglycinamide formyltransferase [Bacteroidetes bacterium]|nr:phosphoribosylglycinamide formyltransferase [Bacteroidota bacterium]
MTNIAIFASGSGTNAQRIIEYFANNSKIQISLVLSNKSDAFVLERAKKLNKPSFVFTADQFKNTDIVIEKLKEYNIDFIVLAGFLLKVPENIIKAFPNSIINIHPALLPKYGGKGMYGANVHKAVIEAKEPKSGITIHYVNEHYDEGQIVFQATCEISENDTAETLAEKIHLLEFEHFPRIIEEVVRK